MPTYVKNPTPDWPAWLTTAVQTAGLSPATTAIESGGDAARIGGKLVEDLLGKIYRPAVPGSGLPARMRYMQGGSGPTDPVLLRGLRGAMNEKMTATPEEFGDLIHSGALVETPSPNAGVGLQGLVQRLKAALEGR